MIPAPAALEPELGKDPPIHSHSHIFRTSSMKDKYKCLIQAGSGNELRLSSVGYL